MSTAELPTMMIMDIAPQELASRLRSALQATVFGSRRLITPRRIGQIAEEAASSFLHYAHGIHDDSVVQAFGHRLANDGLGHTTALAVVNTLHEITWERERDQPVLSEIPLSVVYTNALLAGYMSGREATLLEEQERARIGYNRAQAKLTP